MRKIVVFLVLAVMMVFCFPVAGFGGSAAIDEIKELKKSGKMSNEYINHSIIDLTDVSQGEISTRTYIGAGETLTENTFSVEPQANSVATDKITRFMFELTNRYRPETTLPLSVSSDRNTVHAYTYGTMKYEAMWAVVNGLVDCLGNPRIEKHNSGSKGSSSNEGASNSSSNDWIEKYTPEQIEATIATSTSTFTINDSSYTVSGKVYSMDTAPEIVSNRTFVPVRYLAYSLGVPESGIAWSQETQTAVITRDGTTISLTIGSAAALVNGGPVQMDAAPYIKDGRTMLPARWVAEPLGAEVGWDEATRQVTLEIPQE